MAPFTSAKEQARDIIATYTKEHLYGIVTETKTKEETFDYMVDCLANILTGRLIKGTYTPTEFNAILCELTRYLDKIFFR